MSFRRQPWESLRSWARFRRGGRRGGQGAAAALALSCAAVRAQDTITPSPVPPLGPVEPGIGLRTLGEVFPGPWDFYSAASDVLTQLKWGPFHVHPHFYYQLMHSSRLATLGTPGTETTLNSFSPGFGVQIGQRWSVDYTPTLRFYEQGPYQDGVNHMASIRGLMSYEDWGFKIAHIYHHLEDSILDTLEQTIQDVNSTALSADRALSTRLGLEVVLNRDSRDAEQFTDTTSWQGTVWLGYQLFPQLNLAFGAAAGHVDIHDDLVGDVEMVFEQVNARISYLPAEKIQMSGYVGMDFRQVISEGGRDQANPIFSGSITYQPVEPTLITLYGSHLIGAGYYGGQTVTTTRLTAQWRQRFFERFYLDVAGGISLVNYELVVSSVDGEALIPAPDYQSEFVGVRGSTRLWQRFALGVFYRFTHYSSDVRPSYDDHQFGMDIGVRF
jgi:hypothetical protein